ncbi:MAG: DUF2207 domain-containing protein [Tissierella sp.]|uniref:DUF2207 domain-containing protein n=1 Tax=Tissierella sp. TaxID=41274 RepID=UPI003F9BD876
MKKRVFCLLFVLLLTIIVSSPASFAADDLNIDRWIVDAYVNENGDLEISEDITFNFDSNFNGVYRDIVLEKIDSVEDLSIYEMIGGEENSYKEVNEAKKGDKDVFTRKKEKKNLQLQIFSPSSDEKKTFRLNYLLENVAIKHSDTGEVYYKFLGKENETHIDYFAINLHLPNFERNKINIFAHGPSQGKIYFSDDKIKSEIRDVNPDEFIENRILFPNEYIPLSENTGSGDFNSIIEEEKLLAKEKEAEIEKKEKRSSLLTKISIYFSLFITSIVFFTFYKFRRNKDIFENMTSPYPDDITPAELSLFMNKAVSPRAFLASLFYLSSKDYIEIKDIEDENGDTSNEYIFIKKENTRASLTSAESFLLDWIFNDIGDGKSLTALDLEKYRKKNYKDFYTSQREWNKLVKKDLQMRNYYDERTKPFSVLLIVLSIVGFVIGIVSLAFESLYGLIPLILAIFILIYGVLLLYKTNDKGYIQYSLWRDFKKEFKDHGNKVVDINNDKALIYALALELAMKDLNSFRNSIASSYYPVGWGYLYFLTNKNGGSRFEDTFNHSFYGSSQSTSSTSTGSFGGGGGFTGGGGGGAGGGGAGGF